MPKVANPKTVVVSFRITTEIERLLEEIIVKYEPYRVNSTRKLARRIVVDFARKRLKYINPEHLVKDAEAPPALPPAPSRSRKKAQ